MNRYSRYAITVLCLLLAIACYALGVPTGGFLFLLLGIFFEGMFWIRLFRRNKTKA
jgi:hypothetical protein